MISGVGYNYRWAPLVRYAKQLIESGELGELTNYRGRFFSMYGSDPLGLLSWRFKLDEGGYGVTSDLLSHSVDLAHMLLGPITRVVGTTATFITERPLALPGAGHYGRGALGDPTGEVTNEDYAGMLCEFANGVRGTFESSRTIVGPESQMAFDVHGTQGRRRLEPREAQRAAAVPAHRRPRLGLHDGLRRRPLPLPREFRPRQRERDRLRGPGGRRGLRVLPRDRRRTAVLARVQGGRRVGQRAGRAAEVRPDRALGACRPRSRRTEMAATTTKAVRIGVIGAGRIGRMHAELLARQVPGARLTAVQDADEDTARSVAAPLGAAPVPTADDVFEDADAVAICTPTPSHARADRRGRARGQGDLLREAGVAGPGRGRPRAGRGAGGRRAVPDRLQPPLRPRARRGRRRGRRRHGRRAAARAHLQPRPGAAAARATSPPRAGSSST